MKCPKCRNTMTSEATLTTPIVVTHTCPFCGHIHTVTFGGNESNERRNPNALGHTLTVRHWNQVLRRDEFHRYQIVGISKDGFGRLTYLIPLWNEGRNFLAGYSEESSFFHSISRDAVPMSEANKAAAAFIRYNRLAALCQTLYSRYAWMEYPALAIQSVQSTYGNVDTLQTVYELDEPMNLAQVAKRKRNYYAALAQAALSASGLRAEAVQA